MASTDLQPLSEDAKIRLLAPVGSCRLWAQALRRVSELCLQELLGGASRALESGAEELESWIPQWKSGFSSGYIDEGFCKNGLLNNPRRILIKPHIRHLMKIIRDAGAASATLGIPKTEALTMAEKVAQDTISEAESYLIIVAALIRSSSVATSPMLLVWIAMSWTSSPAGHRCKCLSLCSTA